MSGYSLLKNYLDPKQILDESSPELLHEYGQDESNFAAVSPRLVLFPSEVSQLQDIVALCNENTIAITPRGAGSGRTGGAVPSPDSIVVSTERMNKILDLDVENLRIRVQPGVITGELATAAQKQQMFYPPDPASLEYCSIGGNVACNAGGPRAFRYGVTRNYVLGLKAISPGQGLLKLGSQTMKSVSGYDLTSLLVGSEGTLGLIAEIDLKLLPHPQKRQSVLAFFPSAEMSIRCVSELIQRRYWPSALEFADEIATKAACRAKFKSFKGSMLLVSIDGRADTVHSEVTDVGLTLEKLGASDVLVAQNTKDEREFWQLRRGMSKALRESCVCRVSEDICVPRNRMAEMLRSIESIANDNQLQHATFGHAGDGNLHASFIANKPRELVSSQIDRAIHQLFASALSMGGTLSGEHGIGLSKRDYMPLEHSPDSLSLQRGIKRLLDPKNIMNPGKVLPEFQSCHE